ncbi:MAG: glycosyltransferase family 2 protein [Elusimicrobia bacterium]|nr:glycosyltransferase family 2 protein [Elusimicrobiota bacterium]
MAASPYLSVLVPIYNEEENLADMAAEVHAAMGLVGRTWEVILVDDGSRDGSWKGIQDSVKQDPGFKALRLATNLGQSAALAAGIRHAEGEVVACLDADLQNDPKDLPALLKKLDEGYDVVSGWRKDRRDPWLTRRLPSEIANAIISKVTGVALHDYGCTLKVYRSLFIKELRLYGEMHRFIPAFAGFLGARIAELPVNHRPRMRGVSKYGLTRILKVVLDLITVKFLDEYITKPIYLFGGGGVLLGGLGAALAVYTLYKKLFLGIFVKDQPLFQVSIFFALVGFQMIFLGLLAEILIRVYYDIKDKPPYFIRERVGPFSGQA